MQRCFLSAKLHRATVTQTDLEYEGSCGVDSDLLRLSGMVPNERVEIYNLQTGARFSTYLIAEPSGSGAVTLNGAAARLAQKGDRIIICTFVWCDAAEPPPTPRILLLDENNRAQKKP